MKSFLLLCLVMAVFAVEQQMYPAYVPDSIPWDNPALPLTNADLIPNAPDCVVRPSTVQEIKKMRLDASYIGSMIEKEVHIMERRKLYVEQMTSYLNDRIRELNQVKSELLAESKWIQVMQHRISELQQKEKLIKLEDISSCLKDQKSQQTQDATTKDNSVKDLEKKITALHTDIDTINLKIKNIECPIENEKQTVWDTASKTCKAPTS